MIVAFRSAKGRPFAERKATMSGDPNCRRMGQRSGDRLRRDDASFDSSNPMTARQSAARLFLPSPLAGERRAHSSPLSPPRERGRE
jgi:hypothetical protein